MQMNKQKQNYQALKKKQQDFINVTNLKIDENSLHFI